MVFVSTDSKTYDSLQFLLLDLPFTEYSWLVDPYSTLPVHSPGYLCHSISTGLNHAPPNTHTCIGRLTYCVWVPVSHCCHQYWSPPCTHLCLTHPPITTVYINGLSWPLTQMTLLSIQLTAAVKLCHITHRHPLWFLLSATQTVSAWLNLLQIFPSIRL